MVGYIYLTTDTTNGKQYVGKHHYNKEGELDPSYHGSGVIIKNIYKKRPETLKEEYVKTCYSEEEMCSDEQYYIKFFKTLWPYGYNLTEGGDGGEIPCEEIRKKISLKLKGRTLSEETRKKMSLTQKGKNIWMKGKHHSEETKKKISESNKGRPSGMLGKKHSEETKKKMSESLSGKKNPFYGKHHSEENKIKWSEKKKGKHHTEETREKLREANTNGKCSKPVLQFTLDGEFVKEWPSVMECERNGFNHSSVSACCRGEQKSAYGFLWQYK